MPIGARVSFLPVGQGTCNMVEVYEQEATGWKLIWLALIDCGGDGRTYNYVKSCSSILVNAMTKRGIAAGKVGPYLDVMVVSHQDDDHHKILKRLLDAKKIKVGSYFRFAEDVFKVGRGDEYVSKSFNTFEGKMLQALNPSTARYFAPAGTSGLNLPSGPPTLFATAPTGPGICAGLTTLWANEKAPDSTHLGIRYNTLSAYTVFYMKFAGGTSYTVDFPGDATVYTMSAINCYLADKQVWRKCDVMAAPHHGSYVTACDSKNDKDHMVMDLFYIGNNPKRLIVSAGPVSKHGHPHRSFVRHVGPLLDPEIEHKIYMNKTDEGNSLNISDFTMEDTTKRLYTLCNEVSLIGGKSDEIKKSVKGSAKMHVCSYLALEGGWDFALTPVKDDLEAFPQVKPVGGAAEHTAAHTPVALPDEPGVGM